MAPATIAAISSPPGAAQRGVIRLSGPDAARIARALVAPAAERERANGGPFTEPKLAARGAWTTRIHDGRGEQPCLLLWMPGPASYTREDVCELHLPGSPPLLEAALARVLALGARAAAPGEFTRRAFLNGRLDLTQAEGVLALVESASERERRAALALLEGGLTARLADLREGFAELRALAEASLDFDESDTGHVPMAELLARADLLRAALDEALAWEVRRQPPSALPRVVLVGAPNAGKSTLFNALVPAARALVSAVAGSTRDGASGLAALDAAGRAECLLLDAPGVDPRARGADRLAQEIAAAERASADLLLEVVDSAGPAAGADAASDDVPGAARLVVWSRIDLPGARPAPPHAVAVSARTGAGLDRLRAALARRLGFATAEDDPGADAPGESGAGLVRELSARHRAALAAAGEALAAARALLAEAAPLDLAADALRDALDALDGIGGRTTPEDLLDRIFARFCLGK
jgi:tRNA modification GTPase